MKTLIVEDNKTSSKLLQAVLESEGFETELADDGQEALSLLEKTKVDCIISDVMMPNVDGYRLVYKVRNNEKFKDIPFIMYTSSYASDDDERFAVSLGVNKYIRKPGTAKEIVRAIRELIEGREENAHIFDTRSPHENWVMKKYGKLLIDKLEQKVNELEETKRELEWNEKKLKEAYETMEWKVEQRTRELNQALSKEKELVRLKSQFISIASHEFKTPLASVNFLTGMLKKFRSKFSEKEINQRLESIDHQVKFMTDLLDDVLLLGRVDSGNLKAILTKIDGPSFFSSIISDVLNSTGNSTPINPYIQFNGKTIETDKKLLHNIVGNLLSNAIKYSPKGKPVALTVAAMKDSLSIEVKDLGRGISEEDQSIIFEAFTRGNNVDSIPGSGLGLSIVKKSLDLLQGTITVTSKLNEGSVFTVTIPLNSGTNQ